VHVLLAIGQLVIIFVDMLACIVYLSILERTHYTEHSRHILSWQLIFKWIISSTYHFLLTPVLIVSHLYQKIRRKQ